MCEQRPPTENTVTDTKKMFLNNHFHPFLDLYANWQKANDHVKYPSDIFPREMKV